MATKKAPAKKTISKPKTKSKVAPKKLSSKKAVEPRSFRLTRSTTPFLTIAITRQTLYWLIIAMAVLGLGLWTIHLQNKINDIYDTIESNQRITDSLPDPIVKAQQQAEEQQSNQSTE